eukprot:2264685-Pleurochrysis_carterae.AAC.1
MHAREGAPVIGSVARCRSKVATRALNESRAFRARRVRRVSSAERPRLCKMTRLASDSSGAEQI